MGDAMGKFERGLLSLACALTLALVPAAALADEAAAGNTLASGDSSSTATAVSAERDYYWFGQSLDASGVSVGSSLVAAGENIYVQGGAVGGSVRAAGRSVVVHEVAVTDNITAAGETVMVGSDTTCAGAYLAGKRVEFDGTASDLRVAAQDVVISGTVNGDVNVDAGTVTIERGAVVNGSLNVRAASEPVIDSGAKVESVNYTLSSEGGSTNTPAFDLTGIIYLVFVFCLIALALTWLFPVAVDGAVAMVRQRTVAHLVTGLVGMVAALPVALVLLLVAPLAGALVGVVLAVFLVAAPFAGASLVRPRLPGLEPLRRGSAGRCRRGGPRLDSLRAGRLHRGCLRLSAGLCAPEHLPGHACSHRATARGRDGRRPRSSFDST
jgi:cytoskeletal protein CcmA (bactofilin family)